MSHVVTPVPTVERGILFQSDRPQLGMAEAALPFRSGKRSQQRHPAGVQRFQQIERRLHGHAAGVREFSPAALLIRLDHWFVFGESETKAYVAVHMTVGDMMSHLANGPAS